MFWNARLLIRARTTWCHQPLDLLPWEAGNLFNAGTLQIVGPFDKLQPWVFKSWKQYSPWYMSSPREAPPVSHIKRMSPAVQPPTNPGPDQRPGEEEQECFLFDFTSWMPPPCCVSPGPCHLQLGPLVVLPDTCPSVLIGGV